LADGEDFELLFAAAPHEAQRIMRDQPLDVPLTIIGEFVEQPGLWTAGQGGNLQPLKPKGYQH
jgi:thiamine monophosphate kinase